MRKSFLTFVLTLLAGALFAQQPARVNVAEGTLEGVNESGVKTFKGVPFAAPPVGDLRWKAPQPVAKWQGVRQAKEFGPNPMQENIFGDMNFGTKKMSEDCLYLNIWTPAKDMSPPLRQSCCGGPGRATRRCAPRRCHRPCRPSACGAE